DETLIQSKYSQNVNINPEEENNNNDNDNEGSVLYELAEFEELVTIHLQMLKKME
ncbi:9794_t:CDS:1, partial [Entrophospora sp. SA101]